MAVHWQLAALVLVVAATAYAENLKIPMRHFVYQKQTYYKQLGKQVPAKCRRSFWRVANRKEVTKEMTNRYLGKFATVHREPWIGFYRRFMQNQPRRHQTLVSKIKSCHHSDTAKKFLMEHAQITNNKRITWIQDCRYKNELIRNQPQKVINDLKLHFNSYCLEDTEADDLKKHYGNHGMDLPPLGHKITDLKTDYSNYRFRYWRAFIFMTHGKHYQQIKRIIWNKKLNVGQQRKKLKAWCKKNKKMKIYQQQVKFHNGMRKKKPGKLPRYSGKRNHENWQVKIDEMSVHLGDKLTLMQICKRVNAHLYRAGPKVPKSHRLELNSWCFGKEKYNVDDEEPVSPVSPGSPPSRPSQPASPRTRIITDNKFQNIVYRRPADTYFIELTNLLRGEPLRQFRRIVLNPQLTRYEIRLQIHQLAKRLGGDFEKVYLDIVGQEDAQREDENKQVKVKKPKLSDRAATLIRLELEIRHNDNITLYDQCKRKNQLLIEYGDECANEAGLAVNTWCAKDDDDEPKDDDKKPHGGKPRRPEDGRGGRIIKIDEDYATYGPFLRRLSDVQLSEVEIIIKDTTLSKQQILVNLETWSKENHMEQTYQSLVVFVKQREQKENLTPQTIKLSSEAQHLCEEWKLVLSDRSLTSLQACQRKNELLVKFGDKPALELGYQPNEWCMKVEAPPPSANDCSCEVSVSIEQEIGLE
ncbi:hypothetical protein M3Y97_01010200 [Aphelenchoides bicaudatus]|nr:hypothetical protein M3Y97_01010200 [Aphelenchoides bicaudatus]